MDNVTRFSGKANQQMKKDSRHKKYNHAINEQFGKMNDRNYTLLCSGDNKNLQLNPKSSINFNSSIKINSEKSA